MKTSKKKLLLGLGAIAIPIIPIATSISMSITHPGQTDAEYATFLTKVKAAGVSNVDETLKNRFINSNAYKNELNWNKMNHAQLFAAIQEIFLEKDETQGGFSIDEKVNLAKYTIEENMYQNIMDSLGLGKQTVTQGQVTSASGNVTNPLVGNATHVVNLKYDNALVPLVGATGINSDFQNGNQTNSIIYNISNQTIAEYNLATFVYSDGFKDALDYISDSKLAEAITDGSKSLIDGIKGWWTLLNTAASTLSNSGFTYEEFAKILPFEIFQQISTTNTSGGTLTSQQFYVELLRSKLGEHLFGSNVEERIEAFESSDDAEQKVLSAELLHNIATSMKAFINHKNIPAMQSTVDYTHTATYKDAEYKTPIEKFAALVSKYSNHFANDVSLKISGDFINGHALWIKSGSNPAQAWTKVPVDALDIWKAEIDASAIVEDYTYSQLPQRGIQVDEKTTTHTTKDIQIKMPNVIKGSYGVAGNKVPSMDWTIKRPISVFTLKENNSTPGSTLITSNEELTIHGNKNGDSIFFDDLTFPSKTVIDEQWITNAKKAISLYKEHVFTDFQATTSIGDSYEYNVYLYSGNGYLAKDIIQYIIDTYQKELANTDQTANTKLVMKINNFHFDKMIFNTKEPINRSLQILNPTINLTVDKTVDKIWS